MKSSTYLLKVVLLLFCLACFLKLAAPTIYPGDSPQIISGVLTLSVIHGLGFPGYVLTANLFRFLPLGSLAGRINLCSVMSGVLLVFLFIQVAHSTLEIFPESRKQQLWLLLGALLPLGYPSLKYQLIRTEVYALNTSFYLLLIIIFSLIISRAANYNSLLGLFCFIAATSIGIHIFLNLTLIAILFIIVLLKKRISLKRFLILTMIFAMGLSAYLYVPLRAVKAPLLNWGGIETFSALLNNVLVSRQWFVFGTGLFNHLRNTLVFYYNQLGIMLILFACLGISRLVKGKACLGWAVLLIILSNILTHPPQVEYMRTHLDFLGYEVTTLVLLLLSAWLGLVYAARLLEQVTTKRKGTLGEFFLEKNHSPKPPHKNFDCLVAKEKPWIRTLNALTTINHGRSLVFLFLISVFSLLSYNAFSVWSSGMTRNNYLAYDYAGDVINSVGEGSLVIMENELGFALSYLIFIEDRAPGLKVYNPFGGGIFVMVSHPALYERRELTRLRRRLLSGLVKNERPLFSQVRFLLQGDELPWQPSGLVYQLAEKYQPDKILKYLHSPQAKQKRPFDNKSRSIIARYLIAGSVIAQAAKKPDRAAQLLEQARSYVYDEPRLISFLTNELGS